MPGGVGDYSGRQWAEGIKREKDSIGNKPTRTVEQILKEVAERDAAYFKKLGKRREENPEKYGIAGDERL